MNIWYDYYKVYKIIFYFAQKMMKKGWNLVLIRLLRIECNWKWN